MWGDVSPISGSALAVHRVRNAALAAADVEQQQKPDSFAARARSSQMRNAALTVVRLISKRRFARKGGSAPPKNKRKNKQTNKHFGFMFLTKNQFP